MPAELEAPHSWDEIYVARGDDVEPARPVLTGDVFELREQNTGAETVPGGDPSRLLILQHPCALRTNGVDLVPRILVAEVENTSLLPKDKWNGSFRVMPLPHLAEGDTGTPIHAAAKFNHVLVAPPSSLSRYTRVACLSEVGVNLLLQRWVHHNSRVVIPTYQYSQVTSGPYAEADLTEEWVIQRVQQGVAPAAATNECHEFLRSRPTPGGPTRQEALEEPQRRSEVRRAAREHLASMQ